jgi:hypothetical protein
MLSNPEFVLRLAALVFANQQKARASLEQGDPPDGSRLRQKINLH